MFWILSVFAWLYFSCFLFKEAFLSRSASYVSQSTCPDRPELLTHEQFVQRQQEHGHSVSNLSGCPGFRNTCIKHDWLHAADLGVAADVLGGTFQYIADFYMEGASKKERCMSLFKEMQCFYREHNSQNRLPTLTPGMLTKEDKKSKKKSWLKIRAKAGEARSLISFNKLIVEKLCGKDDQFETKLRQTARALEGCYSCLSLDTWTKELLENNARKFAQYFLALTKMDGNKYFRAKPKLHVFLEFSDLL